MEVVRLTVVAGPLLSRHVYSFHGVLFVVRRSVNYNIYIVRTCFFVFFFETAVK